MLTVFPTSWPRSWSYSDRELAPPSRSRARRGDGKLLQVPTSPGLREDAVAGGVPGPAGRRSDRQGLVQSMQSGRLCRGLSRLTWPAGTDASMVPPDSGSPREGSCSCGAGARPRPARATSTAFSWAAGVSLSHSTEGHGCQLPTSRPSPERARGHPLCSIRSVDPRASAGDLTVPRAEVAAERSRWRQAGGRAAGATGRRRPVGRAAWNGGWDSRARPHAVRDMGLDPASDPAAGRGPRPSGTWQGSGPGSANNAS